MTARPVFFMPVLTSHAPDKNIIMFPFGKKVKTLRKPENQKSVFVHSPVLVAPNVESLEPRGPAPADRSPTSAERQPAISGRRWQSSRKRKCWSLSSRAWSVCGEAGLVVAGGPTLEEADGPGDSPVTLACSLRETRGKNQDTFRLCKLR